MIRHHLITERYIYSAWSGYERGYGEGINIWADNFGRMVLLEPASEINPVKRIRELETECAISDMTRIAHTPNIQVWAVAFKEEVPILIKKYKIQIMKPDKTNGKWNYVVIDIDKKIGGYIISSDLDINAFALPDISLESLSWQLI